MVACRSIFHNAARILLLTLSGKKSALSFAALLLACWAAWVPQTALAGQEYYTYDALGRLIQFTDSQGKTTQYTYDAVGNLLTISVLTAADPAPTVTSVTPNAIRRAETKTITIAGANLANATVTAITTGLTVSNVTTAATEITLTLAVAANAPLGNATLKITRGANNVDATLLVMDKLPTVQLYPTPLAIPPDNMVRTATLALSNADSISHDISLSVNQPAIVTITPAMATFAAGQTSVPISVTGKTGGQAILTITSPTLGTFAFPVFVTAEFQGLSTTSAALVGVQLDDATPAAPTNLQLATQAVGVVTGAYISGVTPSRLQVQSAYDVTIQGQGLPANLTVSAEPATGLTLGPLSVAADGASATLNIAVAANAATIMRRLILTAGGQALALSRPDADRILIVAPLPEIYAMSQNVGAPGSTISNFAVYGRNLQGAQTLSFAGGAAGDIASGTSPQVSAGGDQLTTSIEISAQAQPGPRVLTVETLSGTSDPTPSVANTFNVVNQIVSMTPLLAPQVGVNLEGTAAPVSVPLDSRAVGLVVGSVITGLQPASVAQGQNTVLTLSTSAAIATPLAATVTPATGLTLGAPVLEADQKTITIAVTVAADAPASLRKLTLTSAGNELAVAAPRLGTLLVTVPLPEVVSVEPNQVALNTTSTITVRGHNFSGAQQINLTPPGEVTIGLPTINPDGETLSFGLTVPANATTGPRTLSVLSAAGESSLTATPSNTLDIATALVNYTPVVASAVGVQIDIPPVSTSWPADVAAPLVGVALAVDAQPTMSSYPITSSLLGLNVGPVATALAPSVLLRGGNTTFNVSGVELPPNTMLALQPAAGISLGSATVAADGSSLSVPVSTDPAAALGLRSVVLSAGAGAVAFNPPVVVRVVVADPPTISAITPILGGQNSTQTFTVYGSNLQDLVAISIEPPEGIVFDSQPAVNVNGTQIDSRIRIESGAPLGGRVIRVQTLAGQSTATASSANTFTVYPPQ